MITTYGDDLAGWLNGTQGDGTGLWRLLLLLIAVIAIVATAIVLIRTVRTAIDSA